MTTKSFCVLPFFSFENKEVGNASQNIYCCRLPPNTDINQVRQSILQGKRNEACSPCWKLEDQGLKSERQIHNQSLEFYWNRDIKQIEQQVRDGDYSMRMVKLHTSRVCNSICMTCGPRYSSSWAKLRSMPIHYKSLEFDDIVHFPWAEIKSLGFVGGEPLLEKANFRILEKLIEIGNDTCFVHLVTNGSIKLTAKQMEILARFPNLNLCVSIDGIGARFEYLRFPLEWSVIQHNLEQFRSITRNISVSCMISNISVIYLDETLDWFQSQSIAYSARQITNPSYFSPGNLPLAVKQDLLATTRYPQEMSAFLQCGNHTSVLWQRCREEIQAQDFLKKISIEDYLPSAAKLLV